MKEEQQVLFTLIISLTDEVGENGEKIMYNQKLNEFIKITKKLNDIEIIPILMGSVGLEVVTGKEWDAQDLDIHVPGDKRGWEVPPELNIYNWNNIVEIMMSMGYRLIDLHEHEFSNEGLSVEFGIIDTLPNFAGIQLEDLNMHQMDGIKYYLLTPEQYLSVYESSSKDSYRAQNNNNVFCKRKVQRIAMKNTECCHPIFPLFSRQCVC